MKIKDATGQIKRILDATLNTHLAASGLAGFEKILLDVPHTIDDKAVFIFPGTYTRGEIEKLVVYLEFQLPGEVSATAYLDGLIDYIPAHLDAGSFDVVDVGCEMVPFNSGDEGGGNSSFIVVELTLAREICF